MKLVIVGCNPSESSVRVGHYYAGRGNEFWPMLYESGVVPEPFDYHDDKRVIEFGVGLTDLVKRPTKGIEELKREDYAEGRIVLSQKLEEFAPHVVAFNGKLTYEQFAQRKCKFGIQKEMLYGARVYVLPSTSGANATGRSEKVRHFRKLAQLVARIGKEPLPIRRFPSGYMFQSSIVSSKPAEWLAGVDKNETTRKRIQGPERERLLSQVRDGLQEILALLDRKR